jgi:hypothetical protein
VSAVIPRLLVGWGERSEPQRSVVQDALDFGVHFIHPQPSALEVFFGGIPHLNDLLCSPVSLGHGIAPAVSNARPALIQNQQISRYYWRRTGKPAWGWLRSSLQGTFP